ncbi:MAG: molybdopterin molybdotransferase MoeA [Proteobacteria bacterium]|nr:molybdopterin molybdotransferase MoeA [Pseudomonadota bacterium]
MKDFFKVTPLEDVLKLISGTDRVEMEPVDLFCAQGRVLAVDVIADMDLPPFSRSTMDGYAVKAASTFGASESNPAYLTIKGAVSMAEKPDFSIGSGEAAPIPTGGMLPENADSVIMIEHTDSIDDETVEAFKSMAPGQNIIEKGEDFRKGTVVLEKGTLIRPQEAGALAAFGHNPVQVYRKPVIGIISTGDEVVPVNEIPPCGYIRDMNTFTLSGLVKKYGGTPKSYGIIRDQRELLFEACEKACQETDMVLISGGSSVGTRDLTIETLSALKNSSILVHGIPISPGKPTILAKAENKFIWGIPGHVTSAMIVFNTVVRPCLDYLRGISNPFQKGPPLKAILTRNISSAQGRIDYTRVKLVRRDNITYAEPVLGKSGLISTMIRADGVIEVGMNEEGLLQGTEVQVILV